MMYPLWGANHGQCFVFFSVCYRTDNVLPVYNKGKHGKLVRSRCFLPR